MTLRWVKGVHEAHIRTDDGRYSICKDAPYSFLAWGPEGSQDVDYIRMCTAARLRELMQIERRPEDLKIASGRALLGIFTDPDEARQACTDHAAANAPDVPRETPASRSTDPESSREAEQHMNDSGERDRQRQRVLEAVREHSGLTTKHLAQRTGMDRHMVARRMPELERQGLVRRGPVVHDPDCGRQARTRATGRNPCVRTARSGSRSRAASRSPSA